ncbi:hypothetical protein PR048_003949 [Dryococelus australis]|uniref:Uncharacterized protein n=1 Tax=Dryococelus australis TaxID=614101 RepID=A0ABQ9I461_9NEOP|nr:hypothetical protein PR048_003949 [Dryococelus australis]
MLLAPSLGKVNKIRNGEREIAKAQRYIVTTICKGNIQFIMTCDSAKCMLEKLYSIYERDSSHNQSLSDLQNISMKLKSVGHTIDDVKMIGKISSSLPDKFRHFLTVWESTL